MYWLLAQTPTPVISDRAWDYGIASVVLCFIGAVIWKALPWVRDYLKTHQECAIQNTSINSQLTTAVQGINSNMAFKMDPKGDPRFNDHTFSTFRTNKALCLLIKAQHKLVEGKTAEALPLLEDGMEELRHN